MIDHLKYFLIIFAAIQSCFLVISPQITFASQDIDHKALEQYPKDFVESVQGGNIFRTGKMLREDGQSFSFDELTSVERYGNNVENPNYEGEGFSISGSLQTNSKPTTLYLSSKAKGAAGRISECLKFASLALSNSAKWRFTLRVFPAQSLTPTPNDGTNKEQPIYIKLDNREEIFSCAIEVKPLQINPQN